MAIHPRMVTIDCADARALGAWWAKALGGQVTADYDGYFVMVTAGDHVFGFQKVPEDKAGKNRVHVDFSSDDREAEIGRLTGMGATIVGEHSVPGLAWTTLRDPAGNECCVSG